MRYANRIQFGLSLLIGFFLLATLFAVVLYALLPATPATRGPLLLTVFVAILIGTLVWILFLLRQLLRPYRQLLGEAERAPVQAAEPRTAKDEGEFVLETFQSVVAQLQAQRKELERLTAQASDRADSAVRLSEKIVASMPSGLIAFDSAGRSIVINAPGQALVEFDGKALGQPMDSLLKNIPHLSEMVQECLQTGRIYRREVLQTVTSNGVPRRVGGTIAPIDLSGDRGGRGALCLLTDITEVTNLREQVAIKRNLESLGEMSAGLAHEFKNAIATLHGYVQLMQNLELDERGRMVASSLLNEVRSLSEMVTSFLNFARPQPLEMDSVSLPDLLQECSSELKPLFDAHRIDFTLKTSGSGLPEIRADERMLRQAILNLLRNAAQAIPEAGTVREVRVDASQQSDPNGNRWAVIQIEDTGDGIPPADLQRIFIPFFTTKEKGHGIGLALAHRVITQHGGTLTAANSKDGGAVFTIRLPA